MVGKSGRLFLWFFLTLGDCAMLTMPFCLLQVSKGSKVQFSSGNFSSTADTEERTFPQGNEHLLNWARKVYGAVTSFTELKIARNIYIKVGEGKCCVVSVKDRFITTVVDLSESR